MDFDGFDWDDGNIDKCQKHGVSIAEIEAMFYRPVIILPDIENSQIERRFRAVGTNWDTRKLFVVFVLRWDGVQSVLDICMKKR